MEPLQIKADKIKTKSNYNNNNNEQATEQI